MSEDLDSISWKKPYLAFVSQHKLMFSMGVITMLFTSITEVAVPRLAGKVVDSVMASSSASTLREQGAAIASQAAQADIAKYTYVLIAILLCGWIGRMAWRVCLAKMTHISADVYRRDFYRGALELPIGVFSKISRGDIINRGISDINPVRFIHGFTWALTMDIIFFTTFGIVAMLSISPKLTLYSCILFPFAYFPIKHLSIKQSMRHLAAGISLSRLTSQISSLVSNIYSNKMGSAFNFWNTQLTKYNDDYTAKLKKSLFTFKHMIPFSTIPTLWAYGTLTFYGLGMVKQGEISSGDLLAMFSYVLLMQVPLFELGPCVAEWQSGKVSLKRMIQIILTGDSYQRENLPAEISGKSPIKDYKANRAQSNNKLIPSIEGRGITIELEGKTILKDFNFSVGKGERIAIVGPTGSGKTTLCEYLVGLHRPIKPQTLYIQGQDIVSLSREQISNSVAMASSEPYIFAGTVRSNLQLNRDLSESQLWQILEVVCLADDVRHFEQGLDTLVGEWGSRLSGGQKQRLALARCLLSPAEIFVLDDCVNAVDAILEQQMVPAMFAHLSDASIIWVSKKSNMNSYCTRNYSL